jgi:hypothetical protein
MSTPGALKTIRPFHIDKLISTGLFGTEPIFIFKLTAGKVFVDQKFCHRWHPMAEYDAIIS